MSVDGKGSPHISAEARPQQCYQYNAPANRVSGSKEQQSRTGKIQNMEEDDWRIEVKLSSDHSAHWSKIFKYALGIPTCVKRRLGAS